MVRRLNGRNAHTALAQRVSDLEHLFGTTDEEAAAELALRERWLRVHPAVQVYLAQYPPSDDWIMSMHPRRLLERALYDDRDGLLVVAMEVLKHAYCTLGWWHAHRFREQRNMICQDGVTFELSSQELFGVDQATIQRLWLEADGAAWVRLWVERGSRDAAALERAKLGQAELELLAAATVAV